MFQGTLFALGSSRMHGRRVAVQLRQHSCVDVQDMRRQAGLRRGRARTCSRGRCPWTTPQSGLRRGAMSGQAAEAKVAGTTGLHASW